MISHLQSRPTPSLRSTPRSGGYRLLSLLALVGTAACASDMSSGGRSNDYSGSPSSGAGGGYVGGSSGAAPSAGDGKSTSAASGGVGAGTSGGNAAQPGGLLTAGVWDDNRNWDLYLKQQQSALGNAPGAMPFTTTELSAAHDSLKQEALAAKTTLDVAIVLDVTGSMGDEIAFLQAEIGAIRTSIATKYPSAAQRWSLVAYRDRNEPTFIEVVDFNTDVSKFTNALSAQHAAGGGDFPEAPDAALAAARTLQWRGGNDNARLVFWVADAPHHAEYATGMADAVRGLRAQKVHVYPVASSGVDLFTEMTMRETAQFTGGRYVFLTDDSGIGNSHLEPRVPCYFVTKLDKAITRMIDIEMTGVYRAPEPSEQLRNQGSPSSTGVCAAANTQGAETHVY